VSASSACPRRGRRGGPTPCAPARRGWSRARTSVSPPGVVRAWANARARASNARVMSLPPVSHTSEARYSQRRRDAASVIGMLSYVTASSSHGDSNARFGSVGSARDGRSPAPCAAAARRAARRVGGGARARRGRRRTLARRRARRSHPRGTRGPRWRWPLRAGGEPRRDDHHLRQLALIERHRPVLLHELAGRDDLLRARPVGPHLDLGQIERLGRVADAEVELSIGRVADAEVRVRERLGLQAARDRPARLSARRDGDRLGDRDLGLDRRGRRLRMRRLVGVAVLADHGARAATGAMRCPASSGWEQ